MRSICVFQQYTHTYEIEYLKKVFATRAIKSVFYSCLIANTHTPRVECLKARNLEYTKFVDMKIALVTGGGTGIGRAAAIELNKILV